MSGLRDVKLADAKKYGDELSDAVLRGAVMW